MPAVLETSIKRPIYLNLGYQGDFTDSITIGEELLDTEGATISFFVRPIMSRTPVINGSTAVAIWPAVKKENVKYTFEASETSTEGEFMAWWKYVKGSEEGETPEFPIVFTDHGPGIGVKTGGIFDGVYDHMPSTFDALRNDRRFGERRIQRVITLIQMRVTGSYVTPDLEISTYPLPLLDYLSKRVALELCTPGIDYWARQEKTLTAQGPTEITSFPEIINALKELRNHLTEQLEQDWREIEFLVPGVAQRKVVAMPASTTEFEDYEVSGKLVRRGENQPFITRNPNLTQSLITGYEDYQLGLYPLFP